ncbi:MAG: hypothetical protein HC930_01510 [Hydrococcus sp. SU_1_0]|nr:hypothetical protein [Hydrococcus sp. SU_1_0]
MFGILLFVLLMISWSLFFGCPHKKTTQPSQISNIFPENVFTIIDRSENNTGLKEIYDPWNDATLGIILDNKSYAFPISKKTVLLLPYAKNEPQKPIEAIIKKLSYQKLKKTCSLLRNYKFIDQTQKFSGKGITKTRLLAYVQAAISESTYARSFLEGYLKAD